jgi:nucleoside-diphosphate-sugar epimerase
MRIAVTGGLGRLGHYVVRASAQHDVRVFDIAPGADCQADVRDLDAVRGGLRDIDVVVHLGAIDRSFATDDAATMQVTGFEVFFLAAGDAFAIEPTVQRLEALYGRPIPLHDAALYEHSPCASPISYAAANRRLGWIPSTHWTPLGITG